MSEPGNVRLPGFTCKSVAVWGERLLWLWPLVGLTTNNLESGGFKVREVKHCDEGRLKCQEGVGGLERVKLGLCPF